MKQSLKAALAGLKALVGFEVPRRTDVDVERWTFGTEYGAHTVCPHALGANSVMYSVGLGEDVSFDLELQRRTKMTVHGIDPTPRSLAYLTSLDLPDRFHVHGLAIGSYDGRARFHPPRNPNHVSHSLLERGNVADAFEVEVVKVSTMMQRLGHDHLDILKLDIEGAEYEVIEQLVQERVMIRQLLVEYHHQFDSIAVARTLKSIKLLRSTGWLVFHVADSGREISFLHRSAFQNP
jgi:FkbM family methyltransferase